VVDDTRQLGGSKPTVTVAAWTAAWLITAFLLAATAYGSRDPDSQLYAGISARLVSEPAVRWIAPEWWGFWNITGPYFEHPVGMFVVPAALGRAGYPAEQAAYAINGLYQIVAFALAALIGRAVLPPRDAAALAWLLQLSPIAFVFRIRANQEYAVLAGLFFALYATERARQRSIWIAGMLVGFCGVLFVKGVFAFMVPLTCAIWLIARGLGAREPRARVAWVGILLMPLVGALAIWGYESAYVAVTGRSFLATYQARQLPDDAIAAASIAGRVAYNASWYAARVIWYAFPWSVLALLVAARGIRKGVPWPRRAGSASAPAEHVAAQQGAWFGLVAAFTLTAAFSLAHRKADRYIFPVYFLLTAVGAIEAARRFRWFGRILDRLDKPWVPATCYVVLFLITLISRGKLPVLTFWRS
jgi:hypothetical protein